MGELVKLCSMEDLADGRMVKVEILGCDYIVVGRGGSAHVVDGSCTNDWADLSVGVLEGDVVTCPGCGGQFNVTTGEVVKTPPTFPLATYPATLKGDEVWGDVTGY